MYAWKGDRPFVPVAVSGSVLPNLFGKPLGSLITGSFWYGRIYAHTLLFFLVLLPGGVVLWWMYSPRAGLLAVTLAAGVLCHLLPDAK